LLTAWIAAGCAGDARPPDPEAGPAPKAAAASGWFTDATARTGLNFVHETGATGELHLPEIMCAGAALADLDGDGLLDAYLTNGSFELSADRPDPRPTNRLFLQQPDGTFLDATARSGLGDDGYGLGVATGDVDNDGDIDVYLTNLGTDRLYLNGGDGRFVDATERAGLDVPGYSSSAVFCDYDADGLLDLYVARYVRFSPGQVCTDSTGRPDYCNPKAYNPMSDTLLRNRGDGTFEDVSQAAGLTTVAAAGLGVVCEDFDDDGHADFYVANDAYPNQLWINQGDGTFRDRAVMMGTAYNLEGRAEAGMGVIAADLDDDADPDLFMTHLPSESNTFYRNLGGGLFEDATGASGLAQSSLPFTGFGTVAFDAELDGDLDILVANGRVLRAVEQTGSRLPAPWSAYAEPNLLYLNAGAARFVLQPRQGSAFTDPIEVSRGLAIGDVDRDGDVDVLVANAQSPARLYLNEAPREGHWLSVRAVDPRFRRDAIGAKVTLHGEGYLRTSTIRTGFSYLSSSEPVAHFGLGRNAPPEEVEVRWNDGLVEWFPVPGVDRRIEVARGTGETAR
jgi:dUTPase